MAIKYIKNPHFNPLQMRVPDFAAWKEGCAHDPALVEWNGKYYAFSTDTFGAPQGCQVRVSDDLLHFETLTTAFRLEDAPARYKKGEGKNFGNLQEAYDWCVTDMREVGYGVCTRKDGTMSFWAPHCVRAKNGKYRLYYCLTGYFGGSKSCIGMAEADSPEEPFVPKGIIIKSPAGWTTPNAIDPQFFTAGDGRDFLVYGSFGLGIFLVELDPETGLRKDGPTYEDYKSGKRAFSDYYGTNLARGSLEGAAVRYHEGVPVFEKGKWTKKNYYYLTCSYGSLSSVYHIRCGRSESPEGPYLDVNGNPLVCSTDIGTGNKLLGSFRRKGEHDYFCPGHNDLYVTEKGVKLVCYHCRTNKFIEEKRSNSNNFHYLFLAQYDFNAEGWLVLNSNRYAGEEIQAVSADDFLGVSAGKFSAILFSQSTSTVEEKKVTFRSDGSVEGALSGKWSLFGTHYIKIETETESYSGVVMPAWIEGEGNAGLTVSALGESSGMALHLNSTVRI
ncbi:MAG: arabinan endo-1,5-alpha-L-arabinosidase [Clostridia bacterium]|nr:arabinan endo-1,5-alpha-L-arabinosidase [Clostridia bacterium]